MLSCNKTTGSTDNSQFQYVPVELITIRLACETHYIMGFHLQPHSVSSTKWISHLRFVNLNLMCVEFCSLLSIPFQCNPCFLSPAITDMTQQTSGVRGLKLRLYLRSIIALYFSSSLCDLIVFRNAANLYLSLGFSTGVYKSGCLRDRKWNYLSPETDYEDLLWYEFDSVQETQSCNFELKLLIKKDCIMY